MARYLDGFVLVVPAGKLPAYRRLAARAGKVWMEHGALAFMECAGDDLGTECGLPFPRLAKARRGETVFFSWILYRSRAHRDRVNARVMKDPRLLKMMDPAKPPFDMKRMAHGGFRAVVDLREGGRPGPSPAAAAR